jgi:2-succinyl-5-enolpyruvyl-6-hydroxy-3-cyclohexene-1-carboxylate synthase
MAVLQPIVDLAQICYAHGIRHVVISPGSRSAALTLAFTRHNGFDTHVVMDERAAGFIALGIAQRTGIPVVLICTSGSAAYNYAPAVSEAFFQQIPLIIFTADRPREWIHQHDGQTIYQSEIYGRHVRQFFELPADYQHPDARWMINRTVNDAILSSQRDTFAPVHINIPIREPFYPLETEELTISENIRIVQAIKSERTLPTETWHTLLNEWEALPRVLIVGGQYRNSTRLNIALNKIFSELDVPVVGDVISNQKGTDAFISHHDVFLPATNSDALRPVLLITYGLSLISKELKQFLRANSGIQHWHVGEDAHLVDSYKSLTRQILVSPEYFFENLFEKIDYQLFVENADPENDSAYVANWQGAERQASSMLDEYLSNLTSLNDLTVVNLFFLSLNCQSEVHVANSMPIRYVNILGRRTGQAEIFANRGTSGIDGCVSTAIGAALVSDHPVFLLTGDVAFLYDRNGLLIKSLPNNLKIIVINNAGGNIFGMIDGPGSLPELDTYFTTRHSFTAQRTASDSGITYFTASDLATFKLQLELFLACDKIAILEAITDPAHNKAVWKGLKQFVLDNW